MLKAFFNFTFFIHYVEGKIDQLEHQANLFRITELGQLKHFDF